MYLFNKYFTYTNDEKDEEINDYLNNLINEIIKKELEKEETIKKEVEKEEINKIKDRIDKIEFKNKKLEEKLDTIISILNNDIKKNTEKMGSHIDFIERIYEKMKTPLEYICNKVNILNQSDKIGGNYFTISEK